MFSAGRNNGSRYEGESDSAGSLKDFIVPDDDEEDAERHPPETGIKGSSSKYVYFTSFWLFVSLAAGFSPQCADLGRLLQICYSHVLSCISRDRLVVRHANPF